MSKPREFWIRFRIGDNESTHQITDVSLNQLGPYKEDFHVVEYSAIAAKDAEIEKLKEELFNVGVELDQARDPSHCNLCGSCGISDCCPSHGCAHPGVKKETLDDYLGRIKDLKSELAEKDAVLESLLPEVYCLYSQAGHGRLDKTDGNDVVKLKYNKAREVLQKYRKSEG